MRRAPVGHVRAAPCGTSAAHCCCWRATDSARSRWSTTTRPTAGSPSPPSCRRCWRTRACRARSIRVAIDDFLTYLYVPAPTTAYRDLKKLPPAHRLIWQDGRVTRRALLARHASAPSSPSAKTRRVEQFGDLLRDAVRRRLIADVPLGRVPQRRHGLQLGRRRDGRAELRRRSRRSRSASASATSTSSTYARQVAERFGTEHHELVVEPKALDILPTLVRHYGEPYADSSAVPSYYVAADDPAARHGGAQRRRRRRALAGYERHWAARIAARYDTIPRVVRHGLIRPLVPLLPEPRQRRAFLRRAKRFMTAAHLPVLDRYLHWVGALHARAEGRAVYRRLRAALRRQRRRATGCARRWRPSRTWIRSTPSSAPTRCMYLPQDCLVKVDIASMANSLEARSPLLDHAWWSSAPRCRRAYKLRGRTSKWLLRRLMQDRLPPAILTRPKMGFGVPVGEWLRGELRPLLEDTLLSSRALARGYFRPGGGPGAGRRARRPPRRPHRPHLGAADARAWFREFIDAAPTSAKLSASIHI